MSRPNTHVEPIKLENKWFLQHWVFLRSMLFIQSLGNKFVATRNSTNNSFLYQFLHDHVWQTVTTDKSPMTPFSTLLYNAIFLPYFSQNSCYFYKAIRVTKHRVSQNQLMFSLMICMNITKRR